MCVELDRFGIVLFAEGIVAGLAHALDLSGSFGSDGGGWRWDTVGDFGNRF